MYTNIKEFLAKYDWDDIYLPEEQYNDNVLRIINGDILPEFYENDFLLLWIGIYYKNEQNDKEKFLECLGKSSELGNAIAALHMFLYHFYQTQDYEKCKIHAQRAREKKIIQIYAELGNYYINVEDNVEEALKVYTEGIEAKCHYCAMNLGAYYDNVKRYDQALIMFKKAYKYGFKPALPQIVKILYWYSLTPQLAIPFAIRAIEEKIDTDGISSYVLYDYNYLITKNIETAYEYLKQACSKNINWFHSELIKFETVNNENYDNIKNVYKYVIRNANNKANATCDVKDTTLERIIKETRDVNFILYIAVQESDMSDDDKKEFRKKYLNTKEIDKFSKMPIVDCCKKCNPTADNPYSKHVFCKLCYMKNAYPDVRTGVRIKK